VSLAFGFCEYENPEGTLRCIRLLNGWQIQDKKLVVSDF
jgi:RNA-binding protein 25